MIIVAAEKDGKGIGHIQFRRTHDTTKASLHGFIKDTIEPGTTVITDGLKSIDTFRTAMYNVINPKASIYYRVSIEYFSFETMMAAWNSSGRNLSQVDTP